MAKTPLSNSTALATAADLLEYHDVRQVGDLCVDDGTQATEAAILLNTKVGKALLRASGQVESACLVHGRYRPEDLAALTGAARELLTGLVCDLAFWELWKRRRPGAKPEDCSGAQEALDLLNQLRSGERIFGLVEVADASGVELSEPTRGSEADVNRTSRRARRFFGNRE